MNAEWHIRESAKPYRAYAKGIIKILISLSDRRIQSAPILGIARRLRSYHSAVLGSVLQENIVRTIDLETSPGTVFLVNEDEYAATQDLEFLRRIELEYYDMMFTAASSAVPSVKTVGKTACKQSVYAVLQDLHLRVGGHLLVPASTCSKFPSGIESVEILCESIGLCIEAPSRSMGTLFMATVENSR